MRKEKFLKIKHSVFKLENTEFDNIIINGNEIIDKKLSSILKKISEIDMDNHNVYQLEIEKSNIDKYIDIYIKINVDNVESLIKKGIVLPNRESFFKLLNVYQLSNSYSIKKNNIIIDDDKVNEQEKLFPIYPYHIISIGNYYYDLKSHKIFDKFNYTQLYVKGGMINIDSEISTLELLHLFNNKGKKLFILNSNQLDLYYTIASQLKYSKCCIVNNIKNLYDDLSDFSNIFVSYYHIKKYYSDILKEYISKSKEINFLDSIENMINDFEISNLNKQNKFFQLKWEHIFINSECFSSKKIIDIIKCISSQYNWLIYDNKSHVDEYIKTVIRLITPSYKFTDNYAKLKENIIYYKTTNELPYLKLRTKDQELTSFKHFIFQNRLFYFDKISFLENNCVNYIKSNIEYKMNDSTKDLFKLCSKYNNLNVFYYFLNPIFSMENKVNLEISSIEESLKILNIKEKAEEFKLKLAIHERMGESIIYNIKKNLSDMYDNMEEMENKLIQMKNSSSSLLDDELDDDDMENSNDSDNNDTSENVKICPISHEELLPENSAITICNHEFNFIGLLESLFNDKRCPICRYSIDYKQIKAKFSFDLNNLLNILNNIIDQSESNKVIIVSRYENLITYLKKKIKHKSFTIYSIRNIDKIKKFNNDDNKKILFLNRKHFSYELGSINYNHFIFCESIWDDELDQYFGIRNYFNQDNKDIKIDILIPNL